MARVVLLNVSETPPIVSTVSTLVAKLAEAVCCTLTLSPLFTVPATVVYAPPLRLYLPPVTLIAVGALIPATVISLEVTVLDNATPV